MKLSTRTLTILAEMICGAAGGSGFAWPNFRYRSSSYLTEFFRKCDLDYAHNGLTRKDWVIGVLEDLNSGPATDPSLPSDSLLRVFSELMDTDYFDPDGAKRKAALGELNGILARDGLEAYIDGADRCHIRNIGTQASSASVTDRRRKWTPEELRQRAAGQSPVCQIGVSA